MAGDFPARNPPALRTFDRGCPRPSRAPGNMLNAVVAASPRKSWSGSCRARRWAGRYGRSGFSAECV